MTDDPRSLLAVLARQMAEVARRLDRVAPLALPWPLRLLRPPTPSGS